ncbi:2-succinyl-6-hydroxy-2,4-cyclohexadiene-1-carboxylate synthase [Vibrio algicola]|uniref:Putative 2-succinyl-6-hydroxy-2,4-cyclohexadiene-1-carboxylate synthase n=1 Tax=Vibrio algicola TaxID=2662262 RepID=A0A5Q0TGE9_9VIBR|nr:2-succinyl-6-hydroxy-2,4-cyclohexadiene-1-carboxylate synthase [Vibrio algicola]
MLYSQVMDNSSEAGSVQPIPVFLHGFLGSTQDWKRCLSYLKSPQSIQVDLPCHGMSKYCEVDDFEGACQQIQLTILAQLKKRKLPLDSPLVLVGYSLGARISMYGISQKSLPELNIKGAILEGGNFGIQAEEDKMQRWEGDKHWSKRFATESMEEVLFDWYQQGVFATLTEEQRELLVEMRSDNLGSQLGCMLRATSLSKQPYLLDALKAQSLPLLYICGEHDAKFRALAEESGLNCKIVTNSGHNSHHEQPQQYAQIVDEFLISLDLAK